MNFILRSASLLTIAVLTVILSLSGVIGAESANCNPSESICNTDKLLTLGGSLASSTKPNIEDPSWMHPKVVFTYNIATSGNVAANLQEFSAQVSQTLNDSRGWSQLGAQFREVDSGGGFTLYLAAASTMTSFSSYCSASWSCRVGTSVIINQDRWLGATDAWNNAGGSLRDYRHMVINHEVGHWLGHDHLTCSGAGQPAPIMQQQSIDLQGCKFNAWPLPSELWSSRL